jgi:hypothetical protein
MKNRHGAVHRMEAKMIRWKNVGRVEYNKKSIDPMTKTF